MVARSGILFGLSVALLAARCAEAAPPEPATLRPVAVRGGILALPLRSPPPGEGLPERVAVAIVGDEGVVDVSGRVAWIGLPPPPVDRRWTRGSNPTVLRTLPEGADPRILLDGAQATRLERIDGPILLVELPPIVGSPRLRLATDAPDALAIEPAWIEPAERPAIDPTRFAEWRDDRPDPDSPFEWFRWSVLADVTGEPAPPPPGDAATQLMARHVAELWRAGLARVERRSRGVADALRRRLVATVRAPESEREIAGWIAEPAELGSLLALLLDTSRDDEAIMQAALAWMDARTPLAVWVETDAAGALGLGVLNPLDDELVLRTQWIGEREPPLAALIPPRAIERVRVERPNRSTLGGAPAGEDPEPLVLALIGERYSKRIAVAPDAVEARPPALTLGAFVPAPSLAETRLGVLGSVPAAWTTTGSLRLRGGRWELFLECRAPEGIARGEDAVRVRIGGQEVLVRGDGSIDAGGEAVEVAVGDLGDRWRARVVIPESWLPAVAGSSKLLLGCRREAGSHRATAVLATPAWSDALPQVEVDLGVWRDIRP